VSDSTDRPERGLSDWEDQDLLTIEEAGERLRGELRALREQVAVLDADDPARERLDKRIRALEAALRGLDAGPTDLARP
jgi:hypothetical protein